MPTFEFHETTPVAPEQILLALTDFGPDRSKLFPNSDAKHLEVHDTGRTSANVTEGSAGVWERLHYDWSDPSDIKLTTVDSNSWGGTSGHRWQLQRAPGGGTELTVTVIRDPKNLRGRMVAGLLRVVGKRLIGGQVRGLLSQLEARR